jgi:Glycosyltransferase like family
LPQRSDKIQTSREKMISIVCVYNDEKVLNERLLHSVSEQGAKHQIITVDNRDSRFPGAAAALNLGATQATGEWLMFVHQDVALLTGEWLERTERLLEDLQPSGWCGVIGTDFAGRLRGMLLDRATLSGEPVRPGEEVQMLDECVLIHRRKPADSKYFDEGLAGWHAYGLEACCAAIRSGARNYVLAVPVWHDSKSTNLAGLEEAQRYVWQKHGHALKRINSTGGSLLVREAQHDSLGSPLKAFWRRAENAYYHRVRSYRFPFHYNFGETLESLTESEHSVECLHSIASPPTIVASAFVSQPKRERRIIHQFKGWVYGPFESDRLVIATDLARQLTSDLAELRGLTGGQQRLIVCIDWEDRAADRKRWKALERAAKEIHLTRRWDGSRVAIIVLQDMPT